MHLEFHQLERRWEHLRVRHHDRHRRLLASLAASGQQTPIVVVAAANQPDRYLVIDGYKRIAALQQLGRDTVEAVLWPISEADALVLNRSMRMSEQETALEQGWLLAELERHFNLGQDELARRFDRSISWISRRLALGRPASGRRSTAGARGANLRACGHEVSRPDGAREFGRLPTDGRGIRQAALQYAASRPTV